MVKRYGESSAFRKALQDEKRRLEDERKETIRFADEQIADVDRMLARMNGTATTNKTVTTTKNTATTTKSAAAGKRQRRSAEQLKAEAGKVLKMIQDTGKDGISGREIRQKFPGVGQDIRGFVQQYAGAKVRTTGQRANMKYHAA